LQTKKSQDIIKQRDRGHRPRKSASNLAGFLKTVKLIYVCDIKQYF